MELKYLTLPKTKFRHDCWHYNKIGEKLGTIFIHTVVENFTKGFFVFENRIDFWRSKIINLKGKNYYLSFNIKRTFVFTQEQRK
jgi:hypothetical protein